MMRCPRPQPTVLKWSLVLPLTTIIGNLSLGPCASHISTSSNTTLASQTQGSHLIRTISANSTSDSQISVLGTHDIALWMQS